MSATGIQTYLKYAGPEPRTQSKVVSATLKLELYSLRHIQPVKDIMKDRNDVVWANLPAPTNRRAAALSTVCRWRVTCVDTSYSFIGLIIVNPGRKKVAATVVECTDTTCKGVRLWWHTVGYICLESF